MVGIIGNGKFLAKLDDVGSIEYIFYPNLGFEKHIFDSAFAILCDNKLKWHWDYSWDINQGYLKDTNILKTIYDNKNFLVNSVDYATISNDCVVKEISITNKTEEKKHLKLFFYENLRMGEYPKKNTVKFLKNDNCTVKYDGKYVFCIGSDRKVCSYQCGVRSSENSAYKDIENGILKENPSAEGHITDSAICWDIELNPFQKISIPIYILMSKYDDYYDIINLISTFKTVAKNKKDIYNLTQTYWVSIVRDVVNNLNTARCIHNDSLNTDELWKRYIETCKRSVLTILLLNNHDGGIIASPSLYPDYRYVWNRDASYMSVALDLCGLTYVSEKYFNWCKNAQNSDGSWFQNYYINGKPRLTAMQNDQVGTTIWAVLVHYRITHDKQFLKRYWEMVKKAGDYLSEVSVNLSPSYDLWEEKYGTFSYTIGAVYGGLKSAYIIGKCLDEECRCSISEDDKKHIEKWSNALKFLKNNVDKFYSRDKGRFVKSINPLDESIDASILGLSFPYNLIDADDPKMIKTAEMIENAFNYKVGGIGRYPEDVYFGGNPWIITTLWLYLYYRRLIKILSEKKASDKIINKYRKKCHELISWALKYQFNGLFPEQIHKELEVPISAIPLGWSHAMAIIAIRDSIDVLIP